MEAKKRCAWCEKMIYIGNIYDEEWGVPVYDDQKMLDFNLRNLPSRSKLDYHPKEKTFNPLLIILITKKFPFIPEDKIQELLQDAGIIRNQLKIRAAVSNAVAFLKVQEEFGSFSKCIWKFTDGKPIQNNWQNLKEVPATTPLSDAISKDLKKRGFKFVGSTVIYAHTCKPLEWSMIT